VDAKNAFHGDNMKVFWAGIKRHTREI